MAAELPISDEALLARARALLESGSWKVGGHPVDPGVPLRRGRTFAHRRAADGHVIAYTVSILVDPCLAVPCDDPAAEPRWASSRILRMLLDENGDVPAAEEVK